MLKIVLIVLLTFTMDSHEMVPEIKPITTTIHLSHDVWIPGYGTWEFNTIAWM